MNQLTRLLADIRLDIAGIETRLSQSSEALTETVTESSTITQNASASSFEQMSEKIEDTLEATSSITAAIESMQSAIATLRTEEPALPHTTLLNKREQAFLGITDIKKALTKDLRPNLAVGSKRPSEHSLTGSDSGPSKRHMSGRNGDATTGSDQSSSQTATSSPRLHKATNRHPFTAPPNASQPSSSLNDSESSPVPALWNQLDVDGEWTEDDPRTHQQYIQISSSKANPQYIPPTVFEHCARSQDPICYKTYTHRRRSAFCTEGGAVACGNCTRKDICLRVKYVHEFES